MESFGWHSPNDDVGSEAVLLVEGAQADRKASNSTEHLNRTIKLNNKTEQ